MTDLLQRALKAHHERLLENQKQMEQARLMRMDDDARHLFSQCAKIGANPDENGATLVWTGDGGRVPAYTYGDDFRLVHVTGHAVPCLETLCTEGHWTHQGSPTCLADIGMLVEHGAMRTCRTCDYNTRYPDGE